MATPSDHLDDILDLAIFWTPIGWPTPERIRSEFGIGVADYRRRLEAAVRLHQQRTVDPTRTVLERFYAPSILAALAHQRQHQ
ncbi:hypothetical protein P3H15_46050 [Rhodococcus sp. T2V]|nr:hypothetical protein [Rhodococcus sp. T2V]